MRFAEPFHPPSWGNQFTSNYKDFIGGLRVNRGFTGFTGLRRPIRTYKELLGPVKRVGAI